MLQTEMSPNSTVAYIHCVDHKMEESF